MDRGGLDPARQIMIRIAEYKRHARECREQAKQMQGREDIRRAPFLRMSALGQKRTSRSVEAMSALPPKADIAERGWNAAPQLQSIRSPRRRAAGLIPGTPN